MYLRSDGLGLELIFVIRIMLLVEGSIYVESYCVLLEGIIFIPYGFFKIC